MPSARRTVPRSPSTSSPASRAAARRRRPPRLSPPAVARPLARDLGRRIKIQRPCPIPPPRKRHQSLDPDPMDLNQPDRSQLGQTPAGPGSFAEKPLCFPEFTDIPFHLISFLTVQSFFFILAQILFKPSQFSPYTFFKPYLGRFSSDFSVLYVHAFVSKRRLVLCYCLDLFDLFGDCFLFILIVCLYVMIVDHRERFIRGF
jgi:hypothetical protein